MLLFSMYYSRQEQPLRLGMWIGSAGLGYVIAGIASFGIGHIKGSLVSWRLMFIFWGAITVVWGVFLLFALPGSPTTAKFLSDDEKTAVLDRIKDNGTGLENRKFKKDQFVEAMLDLKTWLLFLFAVTSNSPNGGLTTVSSLSMICNERSQSNAISVSRSHYSRPRLLDSRNHIDPDAIRRSSSCGLCLCLVSGRWAKDACSKNPPIADSPIATWHHPSKTPDSQPCSCVWSHSSSA